MHTTPNGYLINADGSDNMGADVTSGTTHGTKALALEAHSKVGLQIVISNTDAVGVLYVRQSIDGSNWVNVVFLDGSSSIAVASGVNVNELLDLADLGGAYLQVFYDRTSGDGQLTAIAVVKK